MQFEFSAGGIVYKREGQKLFVVVGKHSQHHGWVFPKGLIGDKKEFKGQGKEETAIREVQEETGVRGEIIAPLSPFSFWYVFQGEKRKKTVYFFLMQFVSGDITKHDKEMEDVVWVLEDEVEEKLTFDSEKKVWDEAKKLIDSK